MVKISVIGGKNKSYHFGNLFYYPNATILNDNRIIFNIKGNEYRLIVKFNFAYKLSWMRFIGTQAEYDMTIKPIRNESGIATKFGEIFKPQFCWIFF